MFIDPVALDTHMAVKMFVTYFLINVAFQTFLANEDLGDSIDEVEVLMKKHDDFEKSLNAQEEKIKVKKRTVKRFIYTLQKKVMQHHFDRLYQFVYGFISIMLGIIWKLDYLSFHWYFICHNCFYRNVRRAIKLGSMSKNKCCKIGPQH